MIDKLIVKEYWWRNQHHQGGNISLQFAPLFVDLEDGRREFNYMNFPTLNEDEEQGRGGTLKNKRYREPLFLCIR